MIPNQWYAVLDGREVPRGRPVGATRLGEKLVFWRDEQGQVVCQVDLCPHRGCALSIGRLAGGRIQCPFHGFEYDRDGRCRLVPANGRAVAPPRALELPTYPAREAGGLVWIWWGKPRETYPPIPGFDDLGDDFALSRDRAAWPVHYSRAIENQLDVFHLPFVHRTTIGRGERTISDGPYVCQDGEGMDIWVYSRVEDGRPARRADDLPEPTRPPSLRFRFPNLWMNRISDDLRIVVAFVPVDEGHCIFYLQYYQRFVRLPLLRELVAWGIMLTSKWILAQDRRVVITQRPLRSELRMGEKLIPADGPIVAYRRRREELIGAARAEPVAPAAGQAGRD